MTFSEISDEILKELHDKLRAAFAEKEPVDPEIIQRRDDIEQEMKNRELLFNPLLW